MASTNTDADSILLLFVDGGEVESFVGAYRSRAALDAAMVAEADGGGWSREEGYTFAAPQIDCAGRECIYLHDVDREPWEYTLCFIIRETQIIG